MTLDTEAKYPSRRTYFVKSRSDAKHGELAGRLENLTIGRQHVFASGYELVCSIVADLPEIDARPMTDSKGE